MSAPAIVQGDRIQGTCPNHMIGNSSAGPLPFMAPLTMSLEPSVLIGDKPAAVAGSFGYNAQVHAGITDPPFSVATAQIGRVLTGSATVLIRGKPAATAVSRCQCCLVPGQLQPSVPTVQIG